MGNQEGKPRTTPRNNQSSNIRSDSHRYIPASQRRVHESLQAASLNPSPPEACLEKATEAGPTINPNPTATTTTTTMETDDIKAKLKNLDLSNKKEINILLLGETGAGKSTFINSIFNYLQFGDFPKAEQEQLNVLIPAKFSITNKEGQLEMVEVGSKDDANEDLTTGASATQGVKTYSFHIKGGQTLIRLIDTPGMGDTRGIKYDDENCENILSYLNRLHHLHAICYLNKSQQSRSTVTFTYCVTQILSRLEKSACRNIVFVFTHSKGSFYSPGETLQLLKGVVEDIKKNPAHAEIPLDDNSFCFDNEAFMALAAVKQGVELSREVRNSGIASWNKSTTECWKMIYYILGLTPHMVHNTAAINEARRVIYQLAQPMADIAQLVNDNIQILDAHKRNLDMDNQSLAVMKKKLYIPAIELIVKPMDQPSTVCTDPACSESYSVGDKKESHYKRCHDPCYLTNVPRDHLGSAELMNCAAMGPNQMCRNCTHNYKVHMHIYYTTEKKHVQKKDDIVLKNINTKELVIEEARRVIEEVKKRKERLEDELNTIVKCNAKFAHFLSNNAIAPFSDSYAEYINYQMIRERRLGQDSDLAKLAGLQRLLREHNEMKKIFAEAAEMQKKLGKQDVVTPQDISQTMQELFRLAINGKKIRELFNSQKKSRSKEYTFSEYTHEGVFQQTAPAEKEDKKKEKAEKSGKGASSASNPTTKFQRGRPNNRGNNPQNQQRGKSTGPNTRNQQPRNRTPPPPYLEAFDRARYPPPSGPVPPHYPPEHRGYGYPPEHRAPAYPPDYRGPAYPPDYRGPAYPPDHRGPAYPPDHRGPAYPPDRPHYPPYSERQPYHASPAPPATSDADSKKSEDSSLPQTIQVHVTLPTAGAAANQSGGANPPTDPPPPARDYRYPDHHGYPPSRDYGNYPPRSDYHPRGDHSPRDPYAPRHDPYAPRDPYAARDPYDPRDRYPPMDPYHPSRDPYAYPPRDPAYPPRGGYPHHDPRYPEQGPSSAPRGRPYNNNYSSGPGNNNQNNNPNYQRGKNYRGGNRGRGGINRNYRKKNDKNNANNSGDDSDTSVASSVKM